MDNLSVHKTKRVLEVMTSLTMEAIFSVPYSPQYNGIESYWFLIKQYHKKDLLQRSAQGLSLRTDDIIHKTIMKVEDFKVKEMRSWRTKNNIEYWLAS